MLLAQLITNYTGYARFRLNSKLSEDGKQFYNPANSAFHEVLHLLFADFADLARCRNINPDQLLQEEERIVRILENTVYEKLK